MKYYSAVKKKKRKAQIIYLEGKWTKLENVIVCEVTQIQKDKCLYLQFLSFESLDLILD